MSESGYTERVSLRSSCSGMTSLNLSSRNLKVRSEPCNLLADECDSLSKSRTGWIQSGLSRNEQSVRAAISLTCQNRLFRYDATRSKSVSLNSSGGPARRMISSAGNTDSAVTTTPCDDDVVEGWPSSRRFTITAGRSLYLCQAILVVRPSQPASIDDLLSLVPNRQSMRLRRRMRPQFRMAHLIRLVFCRGKNRKRDNVHLRS